MNTDACGVSAISDWLGPLPEPAMWYARGNVFSLDAIMRQGWHLEASGLHTGEQMSAYAAEQVAAERERWTEAVMVELDGNGQAHAIVAHATRA